MPNDFPHLEPTNPFCAARLRPGTIDFVFEHGKSLEQLVDTLKANAWHGQITGGHGTGKSTLLAALTHAIERRGRLVKSIALEAGQRILPRRVPQVVVHVQELWYGRADCPGPAETSAPQLLPVWEWPRSMVSNNSIFGTAWF